MFNRISVTKVHQINKLIARKVSQTTMWNNFKAKILGQKSDN